jgi:hypothetical protein
VVQDRLYYNIVTLLIWWGGPPGPRPTPWSACSDECVCCPVGQPFLAAAAFQAALSRCLFVDTKECGGLPLEIGIPYFRFTEDEWQAEVAESKRARVAVISNSSPLIALAQIGRVEILHQLHPKGRANNTGAARLAFGSSASSHIS